MNKNERILFDKRYRVPKYPYDPRLKKHGARLCRIPNTYIFYYEEEDVYYTKRYRNHSSQNRRFWKKFYNKKIRKTREVGNYAYYKHLNPLYD